MTTPFLVGIGAIAAGLAGRHFLRRSARGAADQWVKGGFKSKMDRKEALAVLGLKCVISFVRPLVSSHSN
jgi:DnaJ family protein C protein 19